MLGARNAGEENLGRHRDEQRRPRSRSSRKPAAKCVRTAVGDKNVIDEMLRNGFNFGGEQSGHMIFRDYSTHRRRPGLPRCKFCAS